MSDRNALVHRQLPEMQLSNGTAGSLRPPTQSMDSSLSSKERALNRFAVDGNGIITGGTGTLAIEGARALLEHGLAGLALWDVNATSPSPAVDQLMKDFPLAKVIIQQVDVTDTSSIATALQITVEELGGVDVLCCFAGVVGTKATVDVTPEEWRRVIDINSTGSFLAAQAVGREMIKQSRGGSIVFIASLSGQRVNYPQPQAAYNSSKAAVLHLSRSLAAEWCVHGIRVNTISPGYMDTILNEGEGLARGRKLWLERNPSGRMGTPSELTGALVLLCSRFGGAYITGADFLVDGGQGLLF